MFVFCVNCGKQLAGNVGFEAKCSACRRKIVRKQMKTVKRRG
jgi:DNA-directed RNA polymerase subunit RPC12/RpoP